MALAQAAANQNRLFMVSKRSVPFLSIPLSITPGKRQLVKKSIRQRAVKDFRLKNAKNQVN